MLAVTEAKVLWRCADEMRPVLALGTPHLGKSVRIETLRVFVNGGINH